MKNNPESGEFCCLHICLFNHEWKSNSFPDDLDAPASSFSLVQLYYSNNLIEHVIELHIDSSCNMFIF